MPKTKPLSAELREFRDLFRTYQNAHQRPTIDAVRNMITAFTLMAEKADALEARARDAEQLEAVALDLGPFVLAPIDEVEPATVPRQTRLVELAVQIGDSNVVTFPKAPAPRQPLVDCQGDGGSAA
ncbi:hypothetical protein AB4099_05350 [Bosea sp. 2KB_26]|uniref:hypothetical protein n=1 Tax=Bosea sp. 2KB_26 TaxID=3237475 RepID=UPI003F938342